MGLSLLVPPGRSSSVKALLRAGPRAAAAAGSARTRMLSATKQARGRPHPGVTVLYVDRGVIVVNKPPGLVSQGTGTTSSAATRVTAAAAPAPLAGTAFNDVLDGLRWRFGLGENPYPVHRLDKGTTGALVLARTKHMARELSRQFRTHSIAKTYLALVVVHGGDRGLGNGASGWTGDVADDGPGAKKTGPGLITHPLRVDDDGRVGLEAAGEGADLESAGKLVGIVGGGKAKVARTAWEVLASSDVAPLSLVRLHPHTGLKHQLRVHMARVLGAPILGDALYGSAASSPLVSARARIPEGRLFLHSSSISFWRYRREGVRKRFRLTISAPLPADFVEICRDLNLDLPEDVIQGGTFIDGERLEEEIPGVGGRWVREPVSI